MADLYFGGSVWCNIDVALRHLDTIYGQQLEPLGVSVVEWYILRFLYEEDGQMASRLANAIGRPATSFTPILDKLQNKGLIERRAHPEDCRAIRIYLTDQGKALEDKIQAKVEVIEDNLRQPSSEKDWQSFQRTIEVFQTMKV